MKNMNPFIYGKPVPIERHIDRSDALMTIFSRIKTMESTAIVGNPQSGKSSLIKYVLSESVLKSRLKQTSKSLIIVEVDAYAGWLSEKKTPADFWRFIFDVVEGKLEDGILKDGIKPVRANQYGSAILVEYFELLAKNDKRVLLVIDEFDSLLRHPNFSNAEFLGGLRSMATNTDGLQLITSSIMSVAEMDEYSSEINPIGSPFFNNFIKVTLELFDDDAVDELIKISLKSTGVKFDEQDRDFVVRLSGRHPYRLQAACAALFDGIITKKDAEERYLYASEKFSTQTEHHFSQVWKRLDEKSRTVLVIMSILWLGGMVLGKDYSFGEIEKSQSFRPELDKLSKLGLVEKVGKKSKLQFDFDHFLLWQDQKWQVACEGIVWWVTKIIIGESREIPDFNKWLNNQEVLGYILTRKQLETIKDLAKNIPSAIGDGMSSVFIQFIKGLFGKGKSG